MRLRTLLPILACLLVIVCWRTTSAAAQAETGRVIGLVIDQTGAVVPGATITVTSRGTNAVRTTTSDTEGRFAITNLPPGPYFVKVELTGFSPQSSDITVSVGGSVTLETRLAIAGSAESVNVVAESPIVNVVNSEVAITIRENQIKELPTLTRNIYDFVKLAGNVNDQPKEEIDGKTTRGTGVSINGARAASTNVLLDGSSNNNEFDTTVGQNVPLDSVQEFSVISNNFSAQFGRASGGIVNVITKSGTNAFRGSVYDFYRSDALTSNTPDNIANDIQKGQYKRTQSGFSLGGPVMPDKLLFFASLERIGVKSNDTQITWVPTPQLLAASSPATRAFFAAYGQGATINGPVLTRGDVSAILGPGAGAFSSLPAGTPVFGQVQKSLPIDAGGDDPQTQYQFVMRVDVNHSNNTQYYGRYAYQNQVAEPGTNSAGPYSGYDTGYLKKNHNLLGSLSHVFSSSLTMQTKVVWNRLFEDQPLNGPSLPTLYMNPQGSIRLQGYQIAFPGYLPFDPGNSIPFGGPQQLFQLYQDQTWIGGDHEIRFGGSYVRITDDRTFGAYQNAVASLNNTSNALTSLDNLVAGQVLQYQVAINPNGFPGGTYTTPVPAPSFLSKNWYNEGAAYVQDNWRLANRLTINLGLRWEYFGPQQKNDPKFDSNFYYSDPNLNLNSASPADIVAAVRGGTVLTSNNSPTGTLWKSDWNNFGPRVGAAWDVNGDGRTSVRGGWGIVYERNFGNVTYNVLFNPPQYLVATLNAPTDVPSIPIPTDNNGPFGGVAGVTKTIPAGSLRHVDQNIETAYAHQYGVSVQHELTTGLSGSIEYNGLSGRKLYDLADINKRGASLVYTGIGTPTSRPNPSYAAFNTRSNRGQSQYHGLTFGMDARTIRNTGLAMTAKYTLSQAKDNLSSTFSDGNNGFFNLGYLDAFDPMLDYGYSEYDVRHRFVWSTVWNIPFFRDGSGPAQTWLGGWSVNWIYTARSGYPFSIYDCTSAGAGKGSYCMRAIDNANISRNATDGPATGNPNEYMLLDLAPILGAAGSYVNPITGNADFGPYPSNMTKRDDFRGPGAWNLDMSLIKRFRFGNGKAGQVRVEAFNVLNHRNMFVRTGNADISSFSTITGYKSGVRNVQLGAKFEF